ncbi:MAG: methyltransferase [Desulfomonilaceae bacterium]
MISDPKDINVLSVGFQKSRIILSAAELDIFSKLNSSSRTVTELCEAYGWNSRGLQILLDALTALGLLTKDGDHYRTEPGLSKILESSSEESIIPMLLHRANMWKSWSNLTAIVSGAFDIGSSLGKARSREEMEAFIGAMDVVGRQMAQRVSGKIDLTGRKALLDIGGGSGVYSRAFLECNPQLVATLFDLPVVVEISRRRSGGSILAGRMRYVEGDFNQDEFPTGHDVALLSAIIHINSRDRNRSLFSRVYNALEADSLLIIRDHIMEESRTAPLEGAIFAVNMLVATRGGNTYTLKEISEDLISAGFHEIELIKGSDKMDQLLTAIK